MHARQIRYLATPKGKQTMKEGQARYRRTTKFKQAQAKYFHSEKGKAANRRAYIKRKLKCFNHYCNGLIRCMCNGCPITNIFLLDLHHVNGGGRKHRKEAGAGNIYFWISKNNFPPGFKVLCCNCHRAATAKTTCQH